LEAQQSESQNNIKQLNDVNQQLQQQLKEATDSNQSDQLSGTLILWHFSQF
jgi:predicted transglutaminase-like cysteine proteinase